MRWRPPLPPQHTLACAPFGREKSSTARFRTAEALRPVPRTHITKPSLARRERRLAPELSGAKARGRSGEICAQAQSEARRCGGGGVRDPPPRLSIALRRAAVALPGGVHLGHQPGENRAHEADPVGRVGGGGGERTRAPHLGLCAVAYDARRHAPPPPHARLSQCSRARAIAASPAGRQARCTRAPTAERARVSHAPPARAAAARRRCAPPRATAARAPPHVRARRRARAGARGARHRARRRERMRIARAPPPHKRAAAVRARARALAASAAVRPRRARAADATRRRAKRRAPPVRRRRAPPPRARARAQFPCGELALPAVLVGSQHRALARATGVRGPCAVPTPPHLRRWVSP